MSSEPMRHDFEEEDFSKELKNVRNKVVDATSRLKDQAGEMASKISDTVDSRPTFERARSRLPSDRRNACVTSTWIADWVASYTGVLNPAAIAG